MLTGLDISTTDDAIVFIRKPKHKVKTRNIGGWIGYIEEYRKTGQLVRGNTPHS
jgi:hypothetical protein